MSDVRETSRTHQVLRGSSFVNGQWNTRSASRGDGGPNNHYDNGGFRVVMSGTKKEAMRRVLRGGSFDTDKVSVRCTCRYGLTPIHTLDDYGFRVVVVNRMRGKK